MKIFETPCCSNCNHKIKDAEGDIICACNGCMIEDEDNEYCDTFYERADKIFLN